MTPRLVFVVTVVVPSDADTAKASRSDHEPVAGPRRCHHVTFSSADQLRRALEPAAAAHGEHEARLGEADPQWPQWYAAYMVAEQMGPELPI